jgi:hypothetical protein
LPFRSDVDSAAHQLALSQLIEATPDLPLAAESPQRFCESVCRELSITNVAQLNGASNGSPSQPKSAWRLTIIDNAACFLAPKTRYFHR